VGGDLQRINAASISAACEFVRVRPDTRKVLGLAQSLHALSGGCFDPCLPDRAGRIDDLELREGDVVVSRKPVAVDLGGIAKGYAIDCAIDVLRQAGCTSGLVNIGGDLRVFGAQPQCIAIRLVGAGGVTIDLREQALAASDALSEDHPPEFRDYYSRIETKPVAHRQAVVIAASAAVADALTKCALLCESTTLQRVVARFNAQIVWLQ